MASSKGRHYVTEFVSLLTAIGCIGVTATASATPRQHLGPAVKIGDGTARVLVVENAAGKPASISVLLSEGALKGLPVGHTTQEQPHPAFEYVLPMPTDAPATGYTHATLDWNPVGHDPEGVYSAPHFDVHFYLIDQPTREAITYHGTGADDAKIAPAADLVPSGYVVPPETAIDKMGVHGVDPAGPEFKGKPFTATFIYGYHKGESIFVEPMVTKAYLETKPDATYKVREPKARSLPGYYPSRYRIGYDSDTKTYVVALLGLRPWKMN